MAIDVVRQKLLDEFKEKFWEAIKGLQEERKKVFATHEEHIKRFPPKYGCDRGCAQAAEIARIIQRYITLGKILGLVDKDVNYSDHL